MIGDWNPAEPDLAFIYYGFLINTSQKYNSFELSLKRA